MKPKKFEQQMSHRVRCHRPWEEVELARRAVLGDVTPAAGEAFIRLIERDREKKSTEGNEGNEGGGR